MSEPLGPKTWPSLIAASSFFKIVGNKNGPFDEKVRVSLYCGGGQCAEIRIKRGIAVQAQLALARLIQGIVDDGAVKKQRLNDAR